MPYASKEKEYQKQYRLKNKKKIDIYAKEYHLKNKEKLNAQMKEYYQANKESIKERMSRYGQDNREIISQKKKIYHLANRERELAKMKLNYKKNKIEMLEYGREYYLTNKDYLKKQALKRRSVVREEWVKLLAELEMNKCSKCGYDKCFAAIDYHHIKPEEKKYNMAHIMRKKVREEYLRELEKCIALCSNCHREYHFKEKNNGCT